MSDKMTCRYCQRERNIPCMNTRDMEDFAISGDPVCYATLEKNGGGEKGMRYVALNRKANEVTVDKSSQIEVPLERLEAMQAQLFPKLPDNQFGRDIRSIVLELIEHRKTVLADLDAVIRAMTTK